MITIMSVLGNLQSDTKLQSAYQKLKNESKVEKVVLSRSEARRSRIRKSSDAGSDLAITLTEGRVLKHGDVLLSQDDRMIIVEYEPEDVLCLKIKDGIPAEEKLSVAIKLGHVIGNMHRPIATRSNSIYIPIQAEAEIENIRKMLLPLLDYISVNHEKIVFEPEGSTESHSH